MDKEKILYRVSSISCILGVCCFVFSIFASETWAAIACFVFMIMFAVCEACADNIKADRGPLSYKKRVSALKFVAEKKAGTPEEFIAEHSQELYECFLMHGYIHEFAVEKGNEANRKWEVTKVGMRKKVEICS